MDDLLHELIIHWNGPNIAQSESIVRQALNIYFNDSPWHFTSASVLHKVSVVVDRINSSRPRLTFMSK